MITVTVTGESVGKLREAMREFLGLDAEPSAKSPSKRALVMPRPDTTETEKAFENAQPAGSSTSKAAETVAPGVVTYKDLSDYIPKAVGKYGRGKIVTLLEGFGAKTGKDLKSEQYTEVMAKLTAEYPL
jgi:hypothetical protein